MIQIETRPDFVNSIANSDAVRPFIREDGEPTDWTAACRERPSTSGVVILSNGEDAVGVFEATAIVWPFQAFQTHILFGATCRGRRALDTYRDMLAWLAARGATLVWGSTPRANRACRWFCRQVGFTVSGGDDLHETLEMRLA